MSPGPYTHPLHAVMFCELLLEVDYKLNNAPTDTQELSLQATGPFLSMARFMDKIHPLHPALSGFQSELP